MVRTQKQLTEHRICHTSELPPGERRIVQIGHIVGREVAAPNEARQILNLDTGKGETA